MNNSEHKKFKINCSKRINKQGADKRLKKLSIEWINKSFNYKYPYHFEWMGMPIIQYPQDIIEIQNLIWEIKPDLIIETGIARGGSIIFSSSMLEMLSGCGGPRNAKVLGIDIDIRSHNLKRIRKHPFSKRIHLIEGSSIDKNTIQKVKKISKNFRKIMVLLDSNHNHEHVLEELKLYTPFVTNKSYCVVFDTIINDLNRKFYSNKPWNKKKNPKTAIDDFLLYQKKTKPKDTKNKLIYFEIDKQIDNKLVISGAIGGYLRRK